MGRVYAPVRVDGRELWTLFDTGSRNTYVAGSAAKGIPSVALSVPRQVGLGGVVRTFDHVCEVDGTVEGKPLVVQAFVIEELGKDEGGRPIDLLFGALAMQQWGIRPVPDEERLDLTHYPNEFIEYGSPAGVVRHGPAPRRRRGGRFAAGRAGPSRRRGGGRRP